MAKSSRRHRLLIYERAFAQRRAPALLIALIFLAVAVWAPGPLSADVVRLALLFGAAVAGLLFLYCLVGPRLCYVQCRR